jgi:Na+/H+-dicarboxylate symporter
MRRNSLSVKIFAGLAAGLALGLFASVSGQPWLIGLAAGIEPAGTIWINLIRMCVIPLVVFALVSGVAGIGDMRRLGRVGARTGAFVFGTIIVAALLGLALALLIVPLVHISLETAGSLRGAAAASAQEVTQQAQKVQGLRQFLLELVPTNPIKAAADGALLPLIVFSVLLGAATGTLDERPRKAVTGVADAIVAALIRLIGWVMELAPIGIACLAAPVAARFGYQMLESLAVFVLTVVAGTTFFAVFGYGPAVGLLARVPVARFARATAPGTTVGFTTTSSLAALPTMMDTAANTLKMSPGVSSFVLPLAAALNRPGSAIYQMTAVVFVAALYGVHLTGAQLATAVATCFLMTFSVAAFPSSTVFTTAPVLLAVGLPVESLALLLGVDRIPDMFRTGLNCIGHQTAAAVVARGEGEEIAV